MLFSGSSEDQFAMTRINMGGCYFKNLTCTYALYNLLFKHRPINWKDGFRNVLEVDDQISRFNKNYEHHVYKPYVQ